MRNMNIVKYLYVDSSCSSGDHSTSPAMKQFHPKQLTRCICFLTSSLKITEIYTVLYRYVSVLRCSGVSFNLLVDLPNP